MISVMMALVEVDNLVVNATVLIVIEDLLLAVTDLAVIQNMSV